MRNILTVLFSNRWHVNIITASFFASLLFGCDSSFEVFDDESNDYAVQGIIDSRRDINSIRISKLRQKEFEAMPGKTKLVISDVVGKEIEISDYTISETNKSLIFEIPNNMLIRGYDYRITIINDFYEMRWADLYYPSRTTTFMVNQIIDDPKLPGLLQWITGVNGFKPEKGAMLNQLFVKYEVESNGKREQKIRQIPQSIAIPAYLTNPNYYPWDYDYSALDIRYPELKQWSEYPTYFNATYSGYNTIYPTLKNIGKGLEPDKVTITGMFMVIYQIDDNWYNLIESDKTVSKSIRIDQASVATNIYGLESEGLGFISSITTDTIDIPVYDGYIKKLGYNINSW